MFLAGFWIKLVNITGLFEHNRTDTRVHRLDVKISEFGNLGEFFGSALIGPDVLDAVAVRDEIDRVADPNGIDVLRISPRRRHEIIAFEIDDPYRAILAAAIVTAFVIP